MKISYKILLTVHAFFLLENNASAQPFVDILNVQRQQFMPASYDSISGKLTTTEWTGNLFLPIELKSKDVIIIGSSYDKLELSHSSDTISTANLHALSLQLGGIKQWKGGRWSTMLLAIPKISSDFEAITSKHYQMGGALLFTYKKSDRLKYKFGLYYNREYFGNFYMPLLGIEWKASDRLNVFGVLPGGMNVEYKISKWFYAGLSYKSITASYRLSGNEENYYVRDGHRFWGHNQLKAFVNLYPVKNVVLFSEIGHTAWRRYELYVNGKDNRTTPLTTEPVYRRFEDGMFFNAGIAFRVRLDNEQLTTD